jgi:RNA polymerase sigma factor (sigma-70 family)
MTAHPERLLWQVRGLVLRSSASPGTEAELLERFVRGTDNDAFTALVARHGAMVLGVCRRVLRDVHQAEDVAQATFLALAQKAGTIRRANTLAAWLHRTAHHLAVKQLRADTRRRAREALSSQAAAPSPPDPLEEISVRELLAIFDEEVQQLPEAYRLPLILCCLEGRSQEEAARQLGWSPGAVKGRLERGRAQLHQRLTRRGVSLSAALVAVETVPALPAGFLARSVAREVPGLAATTICRTAMTRAKVIAALLLAAGVVAAGVAALARPGLAGRQPGEKGAAFQPAGLKGKQVRMDCDGEPLPEGALARLGTLRWRAAGEVERLAFTPDGRTVVSVSPHGEPANRGLCLFDAATGKRTRHISPADTFFDRIALSPGGTRLACGCTVVTGDRAKSTVQVRELPSGRKVQQFEADNLLWLGWADDTRPLAVCLEKGTVLLRDLASGKERQFVAPGLRDTIREAVCAYAAKGKVLAVPDQHGIIHVLDTATGKKCCALQAKGVRVRSLALSSDGRVLASLCRGAGARDTVQLWDVAAGKATRTVAADQKILRGVAFTPDDRTLATVGWTEVRFHDVSTGRERGRARGVKSFAPGVAFSPDSKTLATAEMYSNAIHLWDVGTVTRKPSPTGHTNQPWQVAFSPDGRRVCSGGEVDGTVIVWDAATGRPLVQVRRGGWVRGCVFSGDGRVLYSCWDGDELDFSDGTTGRRLHAVKLDDPDRPDTEQSARRMHLSDDGKTLVAFSDPSARKPGARVERGLLVTGWDTTTRKPRFRRHRNQVDFGIAVSPDARMLALAQGGRVEHDKGGEGMGPVLIEDLASGEHLLDLPAVDGQTWPLAFSPDGRLLAACTFGRTARPGGGLGPQAHTLRLWEVATADEVLVLPTVLNARAAFSPDSRVLAVSAPGRAILLWDLRRGKELRRITGFGGSVTCLAFSPDGQRLVSGLSDSTLLVWDVADVGKAPKSAALDAAGAARAWADLGADARKAFVTRGALALSAEQAVTLLKERLNPVSSADDRRLRRLIADLDSDRFTVREEARKRLEVMGEQAAGALRRVLAEKPSLEVHRRARALLAKLRGPVTQPQTLRALRAVAVLEDVGTPQARQVLETLAKGEPEARLTLAAKASLQRLARKAAARP